MNQSRLTTVALTVLRVILGFLFAAHGWQKFNEWTIAGTQASFAKMGVPASDIMAPAVAVHELGGGAALIQGILTRVVAARLDSARGAQTEPPGVNECNGDIATFRKRPYGS